MKINNKLFIGASIVFISIFGFAKNAESPTDQAAIKTKQISETMTDNK